MKGMIYRDGKFISILEDRDPNELYEELPSRKVKQNKPKKKTVTSSKTVKTVKK